MYSLTEAIQKYEQLSSEKDNLAKAFRGFKDYGDPKSTITSGAEDAQKMADEFSQLVNWLKKLEKYESAEAESLRPKGLVEKLKDLSSLSILNNNTKSLISGAANRIVVLEKANEKLEEEKVNAIRVQIPLLKAMIGRPIYWANPSWKMETHTITGVRFEGAYWSDFFDSDDKIYKGTPQVVIEIDGDKEFRGGDYLASRLGIDLFFDEEEALQHSKYANIPLQK